MRVQEIMTPNPACCDPGTNLSQVARMMVEHDCGEIPIVQSTRLVGVITDRDIIARTVAVGKNPLEMKAGDCMTTPVVTVKADMSVDDCCHTMEEHQIRRVPVVDDSGSCCGMVSQADIARHAPTHDVAEVVREVSQRNHKSMHA